MNNRTDLATELEKRYVNNQKKNIKIGKTSIEFTEIKEEFSSFKKGNIYVSINIGKIEYLTSFEDIEKAINLGLNELLPKKRESVLIVGLGNREITSDSIGPNTCEKILATRHIVGEFSRNLGIPNLKSVSTITPSVLGKTGIESSETVKAIVEKIKPDAVIVIDALCARKSENLFSVIQLTNSGISPGSGVQNARKELSFKTLGIPTVAIGVPTVVEASTIAREFSQKQNEKIKELLLTPKDTDLLSHRISEILANSLNIFLQPDTEREVLLSLV